MLALPCRLRSPPLPEPGRRLGDVDSCESVMKCHAMSWRRAPASSVSRSPHCLCRLRHALNSGASGGVPSRSPPAWRLPDSHISGCRPGVAYPPTVAPDPDPGPSPERRGSLDGRSRSAPAAAAVRAIAGPRLRGGDGRGCGGDGRGCGGDCCAPPSPRPPSRGPALNGAAASTVDPVLSRLRQHRESEMAPRLRGGDGGGAGGGSSSVQTFAGFG